MAEKQVREFEFEEYGEKLALQRDTLVPLFQKLIDKVNRQQRTPTHTDVFVRVFMFYEQMEKTLNTLESTIAALDLAGEWELSQEDWNRIRTEQETNDLFKTFLPHMIKYHMEKQTEKERRRYKGNCVTT